jgi:hypothetical protein
MGFGEGIGMWFFRSVVEGSGGVCRGGEGWTSDIRIREYP